MNGESNLYTKTGKFIKIFAVLFGIWSIFAIIKVTFYLSKYGSSNLEILINNTVVFLILLILFLIIFFIGGYLINLGNREDTPLKQIKDWPKSLKMVGIISVIIFILDLIIAIFIILPCHTKIDIFRIKCDDIGTPLILSIINLPILIFAILLWLISFIYYFIKLKNNSKKK
jgi:hypothetical protein